MTNIIFEENGQNSTLKHRKAQNSISSGRFGDLYRRLEDLCHIQDSRITRESWHICRHSLFNDQLFLADLLEGGCSNKKVNLSHTPFISHPSHPLQLLNDNFEY